MQLNPKLYTLYPLLAFLIFFSSFAHAQIFQGTNFEVHDPVLQTGGGENQMTSTNFRLIGSVSQIAIGTSSATNFQGAGGFLYFPEVTLPVVTATPGASQVSLSWTASVGSLGWTVAGYNVGRSTVSGGPYTYTSVGAVLNATAVGLANGTTYYFVVRPQDFFGNSLATSTQVSATPAAGAPPPPPPPPPGGGGPPGIIVAPPVVPPVIIPPAVIPGTCPYPPPDLNCDGKIDIQDLSIFLFLTPQPAPNRADFNADNDVNLKDLSVLFFSWTERLLAFGPDESLIEIPETGSLSREPGFLERLFGRSERSASVITSEDELVTQEPGGIFTAIKNFFFVIIVGIMEWIIWLIKWFLSLFRG